jgi:tetratricopeptide (TPR) repeat protein
MMGLVLGAGLTVIQAANISSPAPSWSCAYVAERLPRALALRGDDAASAEQTRDARERLGLPDAVLTRASSLALARSMSATRLVMIRCLDQNATTTVEAQAFDTGSPLSGSLIRLVEPLKALPALVDELARQLGSAGGGSGSGQIFEPPSARALVRAGQALGLASPVERARGLRQALAEDQSSIDLRLSLVESLIAARDFTAAIEVANADPRRTVVAAPLRRLLRFQAAAALLEVGRYAEARDAFDELRRERETAAVLNNLGVARFRLRDADASGAFERASFFVDHRQGDVSFNRSLALIFENKAALALPALDDALRSDPSDVRSRLLRVWALRILGRDAERAEEWDRLVARAPSFAALGTPDLGRRLERIFFSERFPGP